MRILVHLSDIHFGRVHYATLKPLIAAVNALHPDLVAISGDLTQRAKVSEFVEARSFLDMLPSPQIVVPGNHDIPLHNLYARFFQSFQRYQKHIASDLEPFFIDGEVAVVGINTARPNTWKAGRINSSQIQRTRDRLCDVAGPRIKVVVTHHPFELPTGMHKSALVGRAHQAMDRLAGCGADLFLAGHLHLGYTAHTAERYAIAGHSALVVQAGTATSTRGRGELNSFNVIRIESGLITVARHVWNARESVFGQDDCQEFCRNGDVWIATATIAGPSEV